MKDLLNLRGNGCLGLLDNYENTFVLLDEKAKGVSPRNWMTVGTIGRGKSNTNQVFIEETLAAGFAQVVVDPEGEYIFMDRPSDAKGIADELARFGRVPQGVKKLTVYRPPLSVSKRKDAIEFSVPFDTLSPEMIMELTEMNSTQQNRFASLYERAVECLRKKNRDGRLFNDNELDISQGYPGIRLITLNRMLRQELDYYNWKKGDSNKSKTAGSSARRKKSEKMTNGVEEIGTDDVEPQEMKIYCHEFGLLPLISDYNDASSYGALSKKLIALSRTRIFDRNDARPLDIERLCQPGHLSVIDMSDCGGQQIINIIIADLLTRLYRHKIKMEVQENEKHKVILTIEEAHGFVSRERQDKMVQTLDQLRRIARRGRKRWLCLHLVTQSPQHLPAELFELANNKIIHQMTGSENLRVLKAAAGSINEGIWENVPSLGVGRAVVIVSGQYPHPLITRIRRAASMRHYDH